MEIPAVVIWWIPEPNEMLLQHRMEEVRALPPYISCEVRDLLGRPLGGRLWVARKEFPELWEIDWDDSKPLAQRASTAGGVVIHSRDIPALANMPGFISDLKLNLIQDL